MIFKQPLWFIKSADFQFFGSILPCCNVVDWSDTYLKFSFFKCLSFKHSQNQGLDNKGGKSLVLLPVLVFENVQQSAKQNLTHDFRKPCRLRSKPFAITTFGLQWYENELWMREIGISPRFSRDKFVPLQTKQRYSTRDISGEVFLTLFFRGFVPFLSLADFVSRDKNLQVVDLQRLKPYLEELVTATTSNHQNEL